MSDGPMTATEVQDRMAQWLEERDIELASIMLRMTEFVLTAGGRAMLRYHNRELRWERVCRRWSAKHATH